MTIEIDVVRTESTARTNLIWNPSFETGVGNWTCSGNISSLSQDSNYKVFETYSAMGTASVTGSVAILSNFFPAADGERFIGSVYIRGSANFQASIEYQWYNGSQTYLGLQRVEVVDIPANTWTRISGIGIPQPGTGYGKLRIFPKTSSGTQVNIDGVLLEESLTMADYFDGSYVENYTAPIYDVVNSWSGTAHASTSSLSYKTRVNYDRVNSLSFSYGRKSSVDLTASGGCSFELIDPNYSPVVGERIEIFSGQHLLWLGYVNDSVIAYGIADGTDRLTISGESYLARAGRAYISVASQTDALVTDLLASATTSVDLVGMSTPVSSIIASHNAYSGSLLTYLQRLQMTAFGNLKENGEFVRLVTREYPPFDQRGDGFTDSTAPTSTQIRFDDLKFAALSDSAYDSVRIEPEIVSPVEVGTISRTFVASTYSASISDATELANYVNDTFTPSVSSPNEVSFLVNGQSNRTWASMLDFAEQVGESTGAGGAVFQCQSINFRGFEYQVVLLGCSFSGNPETARVTLYLGPQSLFPNLVLDDTEFGTLNYSKLG